MARLWSGRAAGRSWGAMTLLACLMLSLAACGATTSTTLVGKAASPGGTPTVRNVPSATTVATPPGPDWIPIASQSPADVLAAVRQSAFAHMVGSAPAGSDGYTDLSHLGTPVLVLAYGPQSIHSNQPSLDYFEIPVLSAAGMVTGILSAQLNATHTAIYVGSMSGGGAGSSARWPSILVDQSQATQIVQTQLHVGLRAGTQPRLVYLAVYDTAGVETGKTPWNAGGGGPQNPIWWVPGADGHDYFVGTDGHAYTLAQLPLQTQP